MIETVLQFSVFLANKPGLLGKLCRELAAAKINIVALTMMDVTEHGVVRIVGRDAEKTRATLERINLPMTETEVLAVTMPNRPGAVADVCERLSVAKIPIEYLYSTTGAVGGKAIGIFKVQQMPKAIRVLKTRSAPAKDMKTKLRNRERARISARR